jgi:hypothetical protein
MLSVFRARYKLTRPAVRGLNSEWRVRAVRAGYIQDIGPESFTGEPSVVRIPPDLAREAALPPGLTAG